MTGLRELLIVAAVSTASTATSAVAQDEPSQDFAKRITYCEKRTKHVAELVEMMLSGTDVVEAFKEIQKIDSLHHEYLTKAVYRIWNNYSFSPGPSDKDKKITSQT